MTCPRACIKSPADAAWTQALSVLLLCTQFPLSHVVALSCASLARCCQHELVTSTLGGAGKRSNIDETWIVNWWPRLFSFFDLWFLQPLKKWALPSHTDKNKGKTIFREDNEKHCPKTWFQKLWGVWSSSQEKAIHLGFQFPFFKHALS